MTGGSLSSAQLTRFDASVLPHLDAAWNLASHLLRDPDDAADAVQESCVRALRHVDDLRGADGRAWLMAIVRNECFTQLRRRRARGEAITFEEDLHSGGREDEGPARDLERAHAGASLEDALAALPVEFREAIVLREIEGLAYKEIAAIAGVPIGTVMSRLARARQRLQRALGAGSEGAEP